MIEFKYEISSRRIFFCEMSGDTELSLQVQYCNSASRIHKVSSIRVNPLLRGKILRAT
jgi:hypothetical protein